MQAVGQIDLKDKRTETRLNLKAITTWPKLDMELSKNDLKETKFCSFEGPKFSFHHSHLVVGIVKIPANQLHL
jgi:hypothetical protein